jgi:hypothetical protein
LEKEYDYFYSKMVELHLSFDKLKSIVDEKSLEYVTFFAKRNDTQLKTFLWFVMIFYEFRNPPILFIYTKDFKTKLFSLLNLIYNIGKKYSPFIYDEIVYYEVYILQSLFVFFTADCIRQLIQ